MRTKYVDTLDTGLIRDRLETLFHKADGRQLADGLIWYHKLHRIAATLGNVKHSAGVIAALSPQVRIEINVRDAANLMARVSHLDYSFAAYPNQIAKAEAIRDGSDPEDVLRGPKETAFFRNIYKPDGEDITVDRWIYRAALDCSLSDVNLWSKRVGVCDLISNVIRRLSENVNIYPAQYQAVVWTVYREAQGEKPTDIDNLYKLTSLEVPF